MFSPSMLTLQVPHSSLLMPDSRLFSFLRLFEIPLSFRPTSFSYFDSRCRRPNYTLIRLSCCASPNPLLCKPSTVCLQFNKLKKIGSEASPFSRSYPHEFSLPRLNESPFWLGTRSLGPFLSFFNIGSPSFARVLSERKTHS